MNNQLSAEALAALISDEIWSNNACQGYVIMALERLGYKPKEINEIVRAVYALFGCVSVEDAKGHYEASAY